MRRRRTAIAMVVVVVVVAASGRVGEGVADLGEWGTRCLEGFEGRLLLAVKSGRRNILLCDCVWLCT